jgi:hypothetical protein
MALLPATTPLRRARQRVGTSEQNSDMQGYDCKSHPMIRTLRASCTTIRQAGNVRPANLISAAPCATPVAPYDLQRPITFRA